MNINWPHESMQVALSLALTAAGLIVSITLWISAKIEARSARKNSQTLRLSMENTMRELAARVEELQSAPAGNSNLIPATTVQSLNMTTRAKALRMHRRGETIPGIATALGVQREEIELLLKLERLIEARVA